MADQSIACPSCGKKIPLTRALRSEIEASVRQRFDQTLLERERELRAEDDIRADENLKHALIRTPRRRRKSKVCAGARRS